MDADGNEMAGDGVVNGNQDLTGGGPFQPRVNGAAQDIIPTKIKVPGTP